MRIPELLAPAGNMERLKAAFRYGADACYVGATSMSLRNFADNFTAAELEDACKFAHRLGKRVYVACNAFARNDDIDRLPRIAKEIEAASADAIILNDAGVLAVMREEVPAMQLHLSTQANTLNYRAARFWHEQGVARVILARELSLDEIKRMRGLLPQTLELEAFVHGAMCISYSGRCLLSNYIANRDSNRGECAQPCRWVYELRERGANGEYLTIEQDDKGTYLLNSRDMNMIHHLPELMDSGICSLKIEGRMKSVSYVATVVNAYRMAINLFAEARAGGREYVLPEFISEELYKASHRPFTTGFYFGNPKSEGQAVDSGGYEQEGRIMAVVLEYDAVKQEAYIEQRNRFAIGDMMSILSPGDILRSFRVTGIRTEDGTLADSAPHPKQRLYIECPELLEAGDILRSVI